MNSDNKSIIITGANGNLGKNFVRHFLNLNFNVFGLDIIFDDGYDLSDNGSYLKIKLDITDENDVRQARNLILSKVKTIDGLVNNASYKQIILDENRLPSSMEQFTLEEWNRTLAVNLTGAFLCSREFGAQMLEQGFGSIVNIASIYGVVAPDQRIYGDSGLNSNVIYGVSKAGLIQLTKYMAAYWRGTGIRLNSISPGGIQNNQNRDFIEKYSYKTMLGRMGHPLDICHMVEFLISDKSDWTTGANFVVDGGFSAW